MTPEQIEQHRKRFEYLMREKTHPMQKIKAFGRYDSGSYRNSFIDGAWFGYLMFAENLEVEIPEPHKKITGDYEWAYNQALEHVESMLKRQGIKVKPCK